MQRRSDSLKANLCQAQQRDLKTIAPLSHRPIVLIDTIDYRTIVFLYYRPNPNYDSQDRASIASRGKNEPKHSEMGPVRQNPIQRTVRSVHMCVHCTVHDCCTQYCTEQT